MNRRLPNIFPFVDDSMDEKAENRVLTWIQHGMLIACIATGCASIWLLFRAPLQLAEAWLTEANVLCAVFSVIYITSRLLPDLIAHEYVKINQLPDETQIIFTLRRGILQIARPGWHVRKSLIAIRPTRSIFQFNTRPTYHYIVDFKRGQFTEKNAQLLCAMFSAASTPLTRDEIVSIASQTERGDFPFTIVSSVVHTYRLARQASSRESSP